MSNLLNTNWMYRLNLNSILVDADFSSFQYRPTVYSSNNIITVLNGVSGIPNRTFTNKIDSSYGLHIGNSSSYHIPVSPSNIYRFSILVKNINPLFSISFSQFCYATQSGSAQTISNIDGTDSSNAQIITSTDSNGWSLITAYLYNSSATVPTGLVDVVYNSTGTPIMSQKSKKMLSTTTCVGMYIYADGSDGQSYFVQPRVDLVNGSEPTVSQLLSGYGLEPIVPGIYRPGIYPSETLFPSNNLFMSGTDTVIIPTQPLITVSSAIYNSWSISQPSYTSYLEYLKGNIRKNFFKIEFLRREDETVYEVLSSEIVNSDGTVTNQNQEGVRRTCSFSIINNNNQYTEMFKNASIGTKFKLYLGYEIGKKIKWFSQGVFVFDNPTIVSNLSDRTIQIAATDKWSMINGQNGGILDSTFVAAKGSDIYGLIRTILNLAVVSDPILPIIDSSLVGKTTTYDITKQAGETVSDLILEIAYNLSCYVYYDEHGRLVFRPFEYDYKKYPLFNLSTSDSNLLGMSKELSYDKIYNVVQVRADNLQNENAPIFVEVVNNDLSDPNSVPNYGTKKVLLISDYIAGIDTEKLAKDRASWELKNAKARQSSISATSLALYHLDVNDVVEITDPTFGDDKTKYLVTSITTPISTSVQSSISLVRTSEQTQ